MYAIDVIAHIYFDGVNIMAKTVTTRLDEESVKRIDELAAQSGVDRSALLRSLLKGLREKTAFPAV